MSKRILELRLCCLQSTCNNIPRLDDSISRESIVFLMTNANYYALLHQNGIVCPKAEGCGLLAVYPSPSAELLAAELM